MCMWKVTENTNNIRNILHFDYIQLELVGSYKNKRNYGQISLSIIPFHNIRI